MYGCCKCCEIDKQYGVHSKTKGTHEVPCDIHKTKKVK